MTAKPLDSTVTTGGVGVASKHARALLLQAGLYIAAGAVLVVAALAYWFFSGKSSASYVTAVVDRGAILRSVTATGAVNPMLTVTVGTYVSGVIQEIRCDFNTHVRKGQLCAKIDPRPYEAAVEQSRANLIAAQAQLLKDRANLNYTRLNRDRFFALFRQNAASRDSYETARNMYEQAGAQVALDYASIRQRSALLDAALVNLGYTDIVSPVDGVVVSRNVTKGQTVAASFQTPTLFLIAEDLGKLQVDTNVSESDVGSVRVGARANFTVEAFPRRTFSGIVTQVRQAPQSVQNVVTYDVVVAADNREMLLKPGMTATVRITVDRRANVLRVPAQALRYVPGGVSGDGMQEATRNQVWVLKNGGPEHIEVSTGLDDDNFAEITGGLLAEGDRVILSERSDTVRSRSASPGLMGSTRFP